MSFLNGFLNVDEETATQPRQPTPGAVSRHAGHRWPGVAALSVGQARFEQANSESLYYI